MFYRELKGEVGFEDYLEYVKEAPSRLFFKFCSGTHRLFEELDRHARREGSQECPIVSGLVRSLLSMFFMSVNHMISKDMSFWTT